MIEEVAFAMPDTLNAQQLAELQSLVNTNVGTPAYPTLIRLAEDWDVPFSMVARAVTGMTPAGSTPARPAHSDVVRATRNRFTSEYVSPVANIEAAPDSIAVMSRNWVLMQARMNAGYTFGEVAAAVGMAQVDYKKLEEGRMLPTATQAAKIAALLSCPVDSLFVAAAPEIPSGRGTTLRGLSILAILRSRQRLTNRELHDILAEDGHEIPSGFITRVERGDVRPPLSKRDEHAAQAIAEFFHIPVEWVTRQIPQELFTRAAANTQTLHAAMKQAVEMVPFPSLVGSDSPAALLLGDGGKK